MEPKRRLPLLPQTLSKGEDQGPPRPPWQWVGFGALGIFVVLLPLAWLAAVAAPRFAGLVFAHDAALPVFWAAPFVTAVAVACLAGGYLVGRWGTSGVGVREAALAGLLAALVAGAFAWGAPGALAGVVATTAVAVPVAALGGKLGLRRRG